MPAADFASRSIKKLVLFDVDGTLTPPRYDHPSFLRCPDLMNDYLSDRGSLRRWSSSSASSDKKWPLDSSEVLILPKSVNNSPWTAGTVRPILQQSPSLSDADASPVLDDVDFGFAENGLTAFRLGKPLATQSFINFVGEEKYKKLVNFILRYLSEIDVPIKRFVIRSLNYRFCFIESQGHVCRIS